MKEDHRYDDMLALPHHVSEKRARMSMVDRGAQFSPFAALTGYDAVIRETQRLTDSCIELAEGSIETLDSQLRQLLAQVASQPEVTFTCFRPDERKSGGAYVQIRGKVRKFDCCDRTVHLTDGSVIPIEQIYHIQGI